MIDLRGLSTIQCDPLFNFEIQKNWSIYISVKLLVGESDQPTTENSGILTAKRGILL